jgi:hypothetical protein
MVHCHQRIAVDRRGAQRGTTPHAGSSLPFEAKPAFPALLALRLALDALTFRP